jgi:glyoxylase-like metal-dependent hydrolase (beta-lactamase superfamily II)
MKKIITIAGVVAVIVIGMMGVMMLSFSNTKIDYVPNTVENTVVQPVKFGHANIYFIKTTIGYILVDTGMPRNNDKLDEAFMMAGVAPTSVDLIIVTHGHMDHVGLIAYAKEITGAKILSHISLSENLANGIIESAVAQNSFGRFLNLMTGILEFFGGTDIEAVKPDILVEDHYDLAEHGIAGQIIHTPGHSRSSLSIILRNGEALIGDMIRDEGKGNIGPGQFYEDKRTLIESLKKVASFEPSTIYLSHGEYIDHSTLNQTIASLRER